MPGLIYQIFVRSFADATRDGKGDLLGIVHKLDYLSYLGVEAIWLSPIFPSPSYHKYDVSDYYGIDPEFGTMADFEALIKESSRRNIKIILDLVISHTSRDNEWFISAVNDPESEFRDYYIWKSKQVIENLGLDKREASPDTGITNPWHEIYGSEQKYYGIFSDGMPDLNLENQQVRIAILEIARFWMRKGVYGFRLDAARHLYPAWYPVEKNVDFWAALREELEAEFGEVYLVGEVWTQPEKVAPYFRGLKANFNFELCYDIRDALIQEKDDKGMIEKLINAYAIYEETAPDFIDAIFLGNHDQERIASVLKNHQAKLKAAVNLLMTLPGQPFLYYGEELGTEGKKPDENLREPFIWDFKEKDFYRVDHPGAVYSHEKRLMPLALQAQQPDSIFNHYKKMIAFRKENPALAQVSPINLSADPLNDQEIVSFVRTHLEQNLLIVQNISNKLKTIDWSIPGELVLATQNSSYQPGLLTLQPFGLLVIQTDAIPD